MAEGSYAEKEKLLKLKHQLELEKLAAKREKIRLGEGGILGQMVAPFAESALDQEAAALKEKQISELIALVEEKLESSNEGKSKPAEIAPSSFQPTRQEFVQQILDERGWSIEDWANEAGVAYHTARDYLTGKRSPFGYNRVKLAKALGISVNSLPK